MVAEPSPPPEDDRRFLSGGGEAGELIRNHAWEATPLGPIGNWPQSLRTTVGIVLHSPVPIVMLWGEDGVMLYNDAYSVFAGGRHPRLLGSNVREGWPEVADFNDHVMKVGLAGGTLAYKDQVLTLHRNGRPEQVWMNLDYSPVLAEDGRPAGVIAIVVETTERVLADRRLAAESERQRRLFQRAPGFICILSGPDLVFEFVNDAYARLFGHRDFVGRPVREVFPDVADQDFLDRLDRTFATGERFIAHGTPIRLRHAPDAAVDERFLDFIYEPVTDETGRVTGIFVEGHDVTDAHRAQEALRESRERLSLIVESATDYAILTTDRERRVTSWSAGARVTFGYAAEEIVGRPADLLFTEEDIAGGEPEKEIAAARHDGVAPGVRWHRRRDGSRVFLDGSVRPLRDAAGREIGFLKIARDESERRAVEERLRESEAQFRVFAQAMPNHVWAGSADGQLYWFNDQVYAYSGTRPGELDGADWARIVHPEDLEPAARAWGEALAAGTVYETEFRIRRADGAYRWFLIRAEPLRAQDGAVARWVGTNTDIHDQKLTQTELSLFNETLEQKVAERTAERDRMWRLSTDLLLVAAFDTSVVAINPAWTRVLGWSEGDVVGKPFITLVHPDHRAATLAEMGKLRDGATTFNFENRALHEDGSYRTFSWTAVPDERFIHAVGRDVTAEREAADALAQAEEQLRQSQKMEAVGQLTGGLAHDFNNLLTGISGSLELLQTRISQGRLTEIDRYVNAAQGASKRAAALTHRLLAFSRRQTLDPKPTDANRLVAGMEELIRRSIGPAIALEVVTAGGLWSALVDPGQLENALLNLCINARDAMPDGGRITIETANRWLDARAARERDLEPGQYLSLCVTDTGTGMSPEVIAKAFDPFFTTKPIGQGTGLGLSMIYGFVRQSGGQVRIYSEIGQGTTMCLYLPRHYGSSGDAESMPDLSEAPRAEQGETVLVVDDEPTVRMLVTEVLEDLGYTAIEAADGPAGLKVLQSDVRIDLLVTDVGLPGGMNGRQVADAGRAVRPGLKVLFITGYAENAVLGNGHLEPGMQVLTKPFVMETLASRIRELIEA